MSTIRLRSNDMVFTPGIIRWAKHNYSFVEHQQKMVEIISDSYRLSPECTQSLLSGKTKFRIEGETVVFDYDDGFSCED